MRIAIITNHDRAPEVRDARDILQVLGHKVVSRWIDEPMAPASPHLADEIADITEAEAVVVFTGGHVGSGPSKGARFFLAGWAYGTGRLLYVCGPDEGWTAIPDIAEHCYRTWGELVLALAAEAAKRPGATFEVDGNGETDGA